jgi:uncharacterized lipoprotein YmbA
MAAALAGCASAPTHFYTLQQSAPAHTDAPAVSSAFLIDLQPVGVPAQVDQPELVVRQSEQRVAVLDNERWAAPLAGELRDALSADLAGALGTRDAGLSRPPATPVYRISRHPAVRFLAWRHALSRN